MPVIKHTIVELKAKKNYESINSTLPDHLKHKFSEVDVDDRGRIIKQTKEVVVEKGKPGRKKTESNASEEE